MNTHRKHAPTTRVGLVQAVADLAAEGHTDTTIAAACGLSVEYVRQLLGDPQTKKTR